MLTEEAHRRMMPDTSPPTVPPSVHYQLQLYKPDEWRERRAAGQVQDLVQCPYCEAQFHCMPFVFHSSRLLKGFFDRPQEYTVVTYRPPPKTDEEIAEEEEKAAEEAKSAGSKTPEAERQKKDAEKKVSHTIPRNITFRLQYNVLVLVLVKNTFRTQMRKRKRVWRAHSERV